MQKKLFSELGLAPELLKAVARVGYEEASPIQSQAIPVLLGGADVFGQSQTGSGKTAAFALPAIQSVDPAVRAPQVLILCPTRELAVQVAEEVAKLAFFKRGVRELPIYGGQSYERQYRGLEAGSQIIIGTPGRVMDHLERGSLRLDKLKMVILDEADRMLDMGFVDDIRTVLSKTPPERQTVMFSATLPAAIRNLVEDFTHEPVHIRIEDQALTVPDIEQVYYEVDRRAKVEVLCRLVDLENFKFGLIFCATKMMVDELTEHLTARGYAADKLHGDMSQAMRERVMARFRKHAVEFLVATDVAARGVDVDDIEVVVNYDLPQDNEDYVHRIGRTGRAGRHGKAITFVSSREFRKFQYMLRAIGGKVARGRIPSAEQVEQKRTDAFYDLLRETLDAGEYKRHDEFIEELLDQGRSSTDIASALIHLAGDGDKPRHNGGAPATQSIEIPRRESRREDYAPRFERSEPHYSNDSRPEGGDFPKKKREKGAFGEKPKKYAKRSNDEPAPFSHEPDMVRLTFNAGRDRDITPGDIVGVIAGAAKIQKSDIGAIRLLAKTSYVDVRKQQAAHVMEKLQGIDFKGRKLQISPAE
ncbi:MAG: DEAD/DEAH box helicase [Chthoniobacteraceae bacterium]